MILQIMSFVDFRDYLCLNSIDWTAPAQSSGVRGVCSPLIKAIWPNVIITSSCIENMKSTDKLDRCSFKRRLSIWVNSAVRAEAYLDKFLQISSLATVYNQACHFPRNRRVVKITAFEEWKFTHCLSLKQAHEQNSHMVTFTDWNRGSFTI